MSRLTSEILPITALAATAVACRILGHAEDALGAIYKAQHTLMSRSYDGLQRYAVVLARSVAENERAHGDIRKAAVTAAERIEAQIKHTKHLRDASSLYSTLATAMFVASTMDTKDPSAAKNSSVRFPRQKTNEQ